MIQNKAKKTLFGILAIVAVIIWGNNLGIFGDSQSSFRIVEKSEPKTIAVDGRTVSIQYQRPKFNPFVEVNFQSKADTPKKKTKPQATVKPKNISQEYVLSGVVMEANSSYAIIKDNNGSSNIIKVTDSIGQWIVKSITEDAVVFSSNKFKDTLWLSKSLNQ